MHRFMLPTVTAGVMLALPFAPALAAAPVGQTSAHHDRSSQMQISQATPAQPEKGSAAVNDLNQQSLSKSKAEVKHMPKHGPHRTATAHHRSGPGNADAKRGQTASGDAAVERLNEQSLSAAKSGQSASGSPPSQSSTPQ